ncbi:putative arabinose 5-phosphate isomerase [Cocos nucifera]|uniref:Putative arabinose 5-phosphate isomerase n=1 Tax=Cocos nucifera TaxID=13894 RepID=A0A8K0MWU3_COCNU|nr:putative arabinose 5-phosphate isomerase [Cocos nucifera]
MGSLPSPLPSAAGGAASKAASRPVIDPGELGRLFVSQRRHLDHFFDHLDLSQASALAQALLDAPGAVFFSGVGKSGIVAHKLSQTLASLGFSRSAFLGPVDALHGDIGSLFPGDFLVLLSKSGSSGELLGLVPCARAKGAYLIAVTSVEGNPLAALCDMNDSVEDVMKKKQEELPVCKEGDMIMDQLTELTSKGCGCLLVVDDKYHLTGTFTDGGLFVSQRRHLDHFFDHLDLSQASALAQALLDAPGAVFFSGVGKSGIVAHKLSQTLASLGFSRSAFLGPVDALHGDIGSLGV